MTTESHSPRSDVTIAGADGQDIAARFTLPAIAPVGTALLAHCFHCDGDSPAAARVCSALARLGIATLCVDVTALSGGSARGEPGDVPTNVEDLLHAADWLRQHHAAPDLLIGHSTGAPAILCAAAGVPEARAVAVMGAPAAFGGGTLEAALASLNRPLLVAHAPDDETVPLADGQKLFEAARQPKSFLALDGCDHQLASPRDATWVTDLLAVWATRYLPAPEAELRDDHEAAVHVGETGGGKYQNAVRAGVHQMLADEPTAMGGSDSGPSPYQFVLAGLGACTSMTMRMYAERKGWTVGGIHVDLDHEKVHARDCGDCETAGGKVDEIRRVIRIEGDLDEEQRARLMEIADKCPVHRTLHSEIKVRTTEQAPAAAR